MNFSHPSEIIHWNEIPETRAEGFPGFSLTREKIIWDISVRKIIFSPGYSGDHWCSKGHFIHCLSGKMALYFQDGSTMTVLPGNSCILPDGNPAHRLETSDQTEVMILTNL